MSAGKLSDLVGYLWDIQIEHGDMVLGVDEDMAPYGLAVVVADPDEFPEYDEKTLIFVAADDPRDFEED